MTVNFEKAIKCNDIIIDTEKLDNLGFSFDDPEAFICYINSLLTWLESHNKNYTKEQYHRISTVKELFDCISW